MTANTPPHVRRRDGACNGGQRDLVDRRYRPGRHLVDGDGQSGCDLYLRRPGLVPSASSASAGTDRLAGVVAAMHPKRRGGGLPLLVLKQSRREPLAVLSGRTSSLLRTSRQICRDSGEGMTGSSVSNLRRVPTRSARRLPPVVHRAASSAAESSLTTLSSQTGARWSRPA